MGIEQNSFALAVFASIFPANDQVGDGFETCCVDFGLRHRVLFSTQAHGVQQLCSALCMRCVIARRCIGRYANQRLEKSHLLVKVGIYPVVHPLVSGVVRSHGVSAARLAINCEKASTDN